MPLAPKKYKTDPAFRAVLFSLTETMTTLCDRSKVAKAIGAQPTWEFVDEVLIMTLRAWGANLTAGCQMGYISSEELDTALARIEDRLQALIQEQKS